MISKVPQILLISIPKSGTHMLAQALDIVDKTLDTTFHGYLYPSPKTIDQLSSFSGDARVHLIYHNEYEIILRRRGIKTIFLYRDPRDIITSHYFWLKGLDEDGLGACNLPVEKGKSLLNYRDVIGEMIKIYPSRLDKFLYWKELDWTYKIRYEDLVRYTRETLSGLVEWLGYSNVDEMIERIDPETCKTFRKGKVGDWKNNFTKKHRSLFLLHLTDISREFGYEL